MRVLFTSLRETSHFLPLVPFIESCRAAGHEVAVAAPPDFTERVARLGVPFFPFGHPGDAGLEPFWLQLRSLPPADMSHFVIREVFAGVCAGAALEGLVETLQTWKPALVVRESQEYAALIAARKLGIPHARVAIMLRSVELQLAQSARPSLDKHARTLGLGDVADPRWVDEEPSLTQFPAGYDSPVAAGVEVHRFRTLRKPAPAMPDWWPGRSEPLVYLTLGTVTGRVEASRVAYTRALAAVGGLPIRVLLTIGNEMPIEALGEVPPNVHVEHFVPQDDILPHVAGVICHGGSGTVIGTLAAGASQVVAPLFADQFDNATRIAEVGAGIGLGRDWTSDELRAAIMRLLEQPELRARAAVIAKEIAGYAPMSDAAAVLQRLSANA
jgi:UDP:flavonoid glycosyltransferase YjiC (YdhE family)